MEFTYVNKNHENRKHRRQRLKATIERALKNQGTVIIPAFSIGRTQELLYELEDIIHQESNLPVGGRLRATGGSNAQDFEDPHVKSCNLSELETPKTPVCFSWQNLEVIIDSPLVAKFTEIYGQLQPFWNKEAIRKVKNKRNPLQYNNVLTINSHKEHLDTVKYLAENKRPAIVIAANGMCNGGRVMNYLKAMLSDNRQDVLFVGYQAKGTLGRVIQKCGPTKNGKKIGYVDMDGQRLSIQASIPLADTVPMQIKKTC